MQKYIAMLAAGAIALAPSAILAKPGAGHPMSGHTMPAQSMQTHMGQGATHGQGWDHMNGPERTGQPGVECEEMRPGHSSTAPGSAFNEEGRAGTRYAGEQPQNSRNTASISQYDVACIHQPQR